MKYQKKIFAAAIVLFASVLLVSCKPKEKKAPVISGATAVSIERTTTFDPKAGVTATDEVDGDLTSKIEIKGTVDVNVTGTYELTYTVKNSAGLEAKVVRKVTVNPQSVFANGAYNYKFAPTEVRNAFFGAAEKYLLDNVYGGVPLFVNSGMSIYSNRVQLPVENYVPVMGWGSAYGNMSKDDAGLKFSDGSVGKAGEKTFRGAFSSNPTTFNQWISDDSVSSDAGAYMLDSLYTFDFNNEKTAYQVNPSMAAELPTPEGARKEGDITVAKTWVVPIKENLKFKLHPETETTGFTAGHDQINAKTFVETYKYALDNSWFRAIAGGSHFWSTSTPVKNAKKYYDSKGVSTPWSEVGLKASEDGTELIFEFDIELSEWNLLYWLSSNTLTPVHLQMAQKLGKNYGTTPQTTAYTGAYYLSTYEPDKKLEYKKNDLYHTPTKYNYTGYNFTIIERTEIVFAEFEAGLLDVAGIPLTKYEQYKTNPGVRRSPGATTFRMNINGLGTKEAQKELFPNSNWDPKPLLAHDSFRKALYFGVDRKTLAHDVLKTSDPGMFLFSNAYLVDAQSGTAFRDTEEGKKVGEGLSEDTYGYQPDAAKNLFLTAVAELVQAGTIKKGTAANPTVIELEVAVQAASTAQAQLGQFVKSSYEKLFQDPTNHVKVQFKVAPIAFPDIYYTKQLVGNFDLGMGGISGSSLDAASFLEVFSSDNRGGFTLNWGFDTSVAEIPVRYTKPGTNEEVIETWSFDGIVSVLNGPINIKDGGEILDTDAIANTEELITALPELANLTIEHLEAFEKAEEAFYSLTPRAQAAVKNADKFFELEEKMYELVDIADAQDLKAAIDALPTTITVENKKLVLDLVAKYVAVVKTEQDEIVTNKTALFTAYAKLIDALITELPAPAAITLENKADIEAVAKYISQLQGFVGKDKPTGVTKETEFKAAEAALKVLVDNRSVQLVIDLIEAARAQVASNEGGKVTLYDKFAINDALAAYNKLAAELQTRVTNKAALDTLVAELKPLADQESATEVDFTIQGLPSAAEVLDLHTVLVEAARAKYNALNAEAKALVKAENLTKLLALEEALGLE